MKNVLRTYEMASGQAINMTKFGTFFSSNISPDTRHSLNSYLSVTQEINTSRYLSLPSLIGHNKRAIFGYIKNRMCQRIHSWQNRPLSKSGKEIMIKVVAQAIPSYCMSSFLLPSSIAEELQRMLNSYWWV